MITQKEYHSTSRYIRGTLRTALTLTITLVVAQSQAQEAALRIGDPAPTAASIGRYGDVPVDLYDGAAQISIPLSSLTTAELDLPISLNYRTSGIRVADLPSWVGAGWSLSAGGSVSRSLRSLPDDSEYGYINTSSALVAVWDDLRNETFSSASQEYARDAANGFFVDPEPDEFYFSLPGRSGRLALDEHGNFHTVPRSGIRAELAPAHDFGDVHASPSITITTEDGTTYIFEDLEFSYKKVKLNGATTMEKCIQDCRWVSTWFLTEIRSPSGRDIISFSYVRDSLDTPLPSYIEKYDVFGGCPDVGQRREIQPWQKSEFPVLQSIVSTAGSYQFHHSPRTGHMISDDVKLDSISVYSADGIKKETIAFSYRLDGYSSNRLFLSEVARSGVSANGAATSEPPYVFTYTQLGLPHYLSSETDHWGYYNGYDNPLYDLPEVFFNGDGGLLPQRSYPGDVKHPSSTHVTAGMLTSIQYPTGGTTDFEYELNDFGFINGSSVDGTTMTGFYVSARATEYGQREIREFTVPGSSSLSTFVTVVAEIELGDYHETNRSAVEIRDAQGNLVYLFKAQYQDGQSLHTETRDVPLNGGTYTLEVWDGNRFADDKAFGSVTHSQHVPNLAGGVRIKSIVEQAESGDPPVLRKFKYAMPGSPQKSSGVIGVMPIYGYAHNSYTITGSFSDTVVRECFYYHRSTRRVRALGGSGTPKFGYRIVTQSRADSSSTVHAFTSSYELENRCKLP